MSKRPRLKTSAWMRDYLQKREQVLAMMDKALELETSLMLHAFNERLRRETEREGKGRKKP